MAHSMPQASRRTEREIHIGALSSTPPANRLTGEFSSDQVNRSERSTPDNGSPFVALAAFAQGRPIGIMRIIDLGDGRGELAVEVVDRWQGCGVGTQLLQAARDRAADLGCRELVGEMLVVNSAAHATMRRVFPVRRVLREGSEPTMTMPVDGEQTPASPVEVLVA